ncbi:MAG: DUF881 domain-containing protein [Candidatus Helarchaeota archaeon]
MSNKKNKIIILIVCIILGFLLPTQFYLYQKVIKISKPEVSNSTALEVAEFIKTNKKLRKQIDNLEDQNEKLKKSKTSSIVSNQTIQENIKNYKLILGITDVEGRGVEITFNDKVDSTQIIDLINAVKNIGAEAISINNRRFGTKSFVENGIFNPPTTIQVIGNPDILKNSLVRSGGIIDQIGIGNVEKKEKIYIQSL